MRITIRIHPRPVVWLLALSLLMAGCASAPPRPQSAQRTQPAQQPDVSSPRAGSDQAAVEAAQQHAKQLQDAIARDGAEASSHATDPPGHDKPGRGEIEWIQTTPPAAQPTTKPSADAASDTTPDATEHGVTGDPPQRAAESSASDSPVRQGRPTRAELLEQLMQDIRDSASPAMQKAMAAVALSLVDPSRPLVEADLAPLNPDQRQRIHRYHQLITELGEQAVLEDAPVDRTGLVQQLDRLLGPRPIRIRQVRLCRRVRGYGVYDAFKSRSFLAGHEQPMIVYVELDGFRSEQGPDGHYRVRLTQDVVLYNDVDGLAVWSQPGVDIMDESRNRRRDFFLVQMIRLPAKLGVGKYRLKVRIKDIAGGSMDELSLPIALVADRDLIVPNEPTREKPAREKAPRKRDEPVREEPEK